MANSNAPAIDELEGWISMREALKLIPVAKNTLQRYIFEGKVRAYLWAGETLMVSKTDVQQLAAHPEKLRPGRPRTRPV